MDFFGLGPQMPEESHRLFFAVRPLDVDNAHPDVAALHATTTCFGIVSVHAFRMAGIAREVHCRPLPRCNEDPPVVPKQVAGIPSMRCPNSSYRSLRPSTSHRPFASQQS